MLAWSMNSSSYENNQVVSVVSKHPGTGEPACAGTSRLVFGSYVRWAYWPEDASSNVNRTTKPKNMNVSICTDTITD